MNHRSKKRVLVAAQISAKGQPEKFDRRQAVKDVREFARAVEQILPAAMKMAQAFHAFGQITQAVRERQEARHIH